MAGSVSRFYLSFNTEGGIVMGALGNNGWKYFQFTSPSVLKAGSYSMVSWHNCQYNPFIIMMGAPSEVRKRWLGVLPVHLAFRIEGGIVFHGLLA
jgi:hypothetical protein